MYCLEEPFVNMYSAIREMWSNEEWRLLDDFKPVASGYKPMSKTEYWNHQRFYDTISSYRPSCGSIEIRRRMWYLREFWALYFLEFPFRTIEVPKFGSESIEEFIKVVRSQSRW